MQNTLEQIVCSGLRRLLLLFCTLFGGAAFAQCSDYMGRATINEISTIHNWKLNYGDFIELKLLDSSIPTSETDQWSLMICSSVCNWAHLSTFTKTDSFFTRGDDFVWGFISWRTSFDVMLRDKWGYTIDYVSVNGHSAQSPACTTKYDSTSTSDSSTRRTRRQPDGTGNWDTPSGNSEPSTEAESNTPVPAGASTLSISDVTVAQGGNAVFDISLPGNSYSVVITYSTFDGTATAGTDYTSTTGTVTVPAGTTSTTITVPTLSSGASSDQIFYLLLDSVTNADVPDHVGIGTITAAGSAIDHYRFEYDGNALTCAAETVTVKACTNADCSTLSTAPTTATFGVSTTEPSTSSVALGFTGSTTVNVAESAVTTVTMSLSSQSPTGSLKCYKNSVLDSSCSYTTADSGFIFYNESDNNQTIPTQIAGKSSDVAPSAKTIVLQAVQTNTTTGACEALFANNQMVSVDLGYQCVDPGSCSSNALQITNNSNTYTLPTNGTYGTHNLLFGTNSKATIAVNHPDVGQVKLLAQKSINLGGDVPSSQTKLLTGNSNTFLVRPFGFYFNVSGNPGAADNTGGAFKKAGETFDASISAVQWSAADDTDNNGVPDSHSGLSDNAVTPSFGQESTPESVTVSHTLVSPSGGTAGTLTNGTFSSFSNGVSSRTGSSGLSWNDVGIISLTAATDSDYLNTGENVSVSTGIGNVGRFVPSHFKLQNPSLTQACTSFSYMEQNFNLSFNLYAYGVGDISLSNYDSGTGTDVHGLSTIALVAENNDAGTDLGARLANITLNGDSRWVNGLYAVSLTPNFSRSTIDGPFDNTFIGLKVDDGDSGAVVSLLDSSDSGTNMNASTSGACVIGTSCDAMKINSSEVKFRYGRLNGDEAFGPATSALSMPLYVEYYDGSSFVTNTSDSCSTLNADEVSLSGNGVTPFATSYTVSSLANGSSVGTTTVDTTPTNTSSTTLSAGSGLFSLTLTAPTFSSGTTGYVPVSINLSSYPWLQFDWDTNGTGAAESTLPTKNVTFGQYRGNDRVISWREKR